ncbi:hypothetical protein [Streptomyces sp. NPDC047718]
MYELGAGPALLAAAELTVAAPALRLLALARRAAYTRSARRLGRL